MADDFAGLPKHLQATGGDYPRVTPRSEVRRLAVVEPDALANQVFALQAEGERLRTALLQASEMLFDAAIYIDQWERRMPVRRAAERARAAAAPTAASSREAGPR